MKNKKKRVLKKIMFNDKYALTQAVLEGRKTQTRRIIKLDDIGQFNIDNAIKQSWGKKSIQAFIENDARYKVGEVVAIAQSYKDLFEEDKKRYEKGERIKNVLVKNPSDTAGWNNKMFVKATSMHNHIRITNVRVQRLQDISDDDCLAEGIEWDHTAKKFYVRYNSKTHSRMWFADSPRDSFSAMIDGISGKGTWASNPYVFAYTFELLK